MTFNSYDELEKYILSKSQVAIKLAQEKVYHIINRFVKEYYAEFTPGQDKMILNPMNTNPYVYERTYQLYRSLVKSRIVPSSNGWVAEVYFDLDALDYSSKLVNGVKVPNKGWSEAKTLNAAMVEGSHGGYYSFGNNTKVWIESMIILNQEMHNMLKKALIDAGIPVK